MSHREKITIKLNSPEEMQKALLDSKILESLFTGVNGSVSREEVLIKKIEEATAKLEALKETLSVAKDQPAAKDAKMPYEEIDDFNRKVDEILSALKIK